MGFNKTKENILYELFSEMGTESPSDNINQNILQRIRRKELINSVNQHKQIITYIVIIFSVTLPIILFNEYNETILNSTLLKLSQFLSAIKFNYSFGISILILCFYTIVYNILILLKFSKPLQS